MADNRKASITSNASSTPLDQSQAPPSPPLSNPTLSSTTGASESTIAGGMARDRRDSDEWDASKVPPSRFQKRKGSIYAVPGSRDGHVDSNYAAKFHEKHAEKGYTDVFKKASNQQTN
ncbi:hypothetical protein QBC42DRAFT_76050 [Cladorrhinum samala]|uniref:Uncharacterized protein n=1 Tax=Cladorrhinum samala TaxID=585594 RepID=A0AAV9HSQ8_9PEZI|nr:hypothetical protein QBC42DRAFT_76050 [Cladorrhinum samala]